MKLEALVTITDGKKTYSKGDVFEVSSTFPESLVKSKSAKYVEPQVVEDEVSIEIELPDDLSELTVKELKEVCKKLGITGYSNKNEADLVEMIETAIAEEE